MVNSAAQLTAPQSHPDHMNRHQRSTPLMDINGVDPADILSGITSR